MKTTVDRTAQWAHLMISVIVFLVLTLSLATYFTPTRAVAVPLCGNGAAPDYGFTYALQQPHWTVDWQDYASERVVIKVDAILDQLNSDSIAQTMILIQPQSQVGNRVNCAVHFLRYMQLGQPEGERKDNGFVFLIVVESSRIDVHYGVGLGLPALTAPELTALNRAAEEAYQSTQSMDQALLALVQGFDAVARNKYAPLLTHAPTPETPSLPAGPLGTFTICGLTCVGFFLLLFVLWMFTQLARRGIRFNPSGSGSRRSGSPFGGSRGRSGFGSGSFGGGRSSPPTRGGSGSGRSGRGN